MYGLKVLFESFGSYIKTVLNGISLEFTETLLNNSVEVEI